MVSWTVLFLISLLGSVVAYTSDIVKQSDPSFRRGLEGTPAALYQYQLVLDGTTEYSYQYEECIDWPEDTIQDYFTWYGFRVQLPDDAAPGNGMWLSTITSPIKENGVKQFFNESSPLILLNYTFDSSQESPLIRLNLIDELFYNSYSFEAFQDNKEEQTKTFSVNCIYEQTNTSISYVPAIYVTLTISLEKKLVQEDPTTVPPTSGDTRISLPRSLALLFGALSSGLLLL
jgi:hypothetical protein